MNLNRQFESNKLNYILNHPEVYDWVRGSFEGYIDLTEVVENRSNYLLSAEYGAILFIKLNEGLYEAHTQVLPQGRGAWALDMVKSALEYMFCSTDAVEILTKVPEKNLAARALARAIGGTLDFTNAAGWIIDGVAVKTSIFRLTIQEWIRTADNLIEVGHLFHEELERQYKNLGKCEELHKQDNEHDRQVGLCAQMLLNNQYEKALYFYNRWAKLSDYEPIKIINFDPLIIDIREALLIKRNLSFEVIALR